MASNVQLHTFIYKGEVGLRGPTGEPGIKGTKGDQGIPMHDMTLF